MQNMNAKKNNSDLNLISEVDQVFHKIADYVCDYENNSETAFITAGYALMDSFACAFNALQYESCAKLLGPYFENINTNNGSRVIGTNLVEDPFKATFDNGVLIRWLDYNDTWLAKEWGHPSDNFAGILSLADFINRNDYFNKKFTVEDILNFAIKAYEIQGILALENCFNEVGIDHVILVKLATAAILTQMLGGDKEAVFNVISQVFADGNSLRLYRHAPNTGSRKSWAAGDASKRALELAWLTMKGEKGYKSSFRAKKWGFSDVIFKNKELILNKNLSSYVMENILFKISFPAEFHAQTAAEAAIIAHEKLKSNNKKISDITKIEVHTQEPAIRIISKTGPLNNFADRDHCLQYIIAVGLIYGELTADHYSDEIAIDKNIDILRELMIVEEDKNFTNDYYDLEKRAIPNSLKIYFNDGSSLDKITVEYPIGHRIRRDEGIEKLLAKFNASLPLVFNKNEIENINSLELNNNFDLVKNMAVDEFIDYFVKTE